jgi:dihydropteroate synthase
MNIKTPLIMGILNITPDSFYEKSRYLNPEEAILRAKKMIKEGADIIDIGGESTRPGAIPLSEKEEINRIIPIVENLKNTVKKTISIDTTKPKVAQIAIENGVSLINDISGMQNPEMIEIAKTYKVDICVMHMQKKPQNMQENPYYEKGIISELLYWFDRKIENLISLGIDESKIIIDPGIGFGKTVNDNIEILKNIKKFKSFNKRLLIGVSRKSFMSKILNKKTDDLLAATLAINYILINNGVDIIRVHDVKEHKDLIQINKVFT